jgi:hypothetical protein
MKFNRKKGLLDGIKKLRIRRRKDQWKAKPLERA